MKRKMDENCNDCMRWEEEQYWTHFQTLHFSQLLLPGFHNRLAIPQKFSTYCKRKLSKLVTLKSPRGTKYTVGLEEYDEKTLAFCYGWDKFVKDHSLEENDLLVFKLHGASEFEVLIFDGDTLCEKLTSYFVRECGHAENSTKVTDFTATSSTSPKRHINPDDDGTTLNQQLVMYQAGNVLDNLIDFDFDFDIDAMLIPQSQTASEQGEHINPDNDTESSHFPLISPISTWPSSEGKYPLSGFKKMRGETSNNNLGRNAAGSSENTNETHRRKAFSLAKTSILPNGFSVIMKRSHVLTKCFLTIPIQWCLKNMGLETQEVVMQVDQTKWHMKFSYYRSRGRGGISTGWKKFVKDNNLCEGDVCVFEPTNSETRPLHLQVYIFRAAEAESSNNG